MRMRGIFKFKMTVKFTVISINLRNASKSFNQWLPFKKSIPIMTLWRERCTLCDNSTDCASVCVHYACCNEFSTHTLSQWQFNVYIFPFLITSTSIPIQFIRQFSVALRSHLLKSLILLCNYNMNN